VGHALRDAHHRVVHHLREETGHVKSRHVTPKPVTITPSLVPPRPRDTKGTRPWASPPGFSYLCVGWCYVCYLCSGEGGDALGQVSLRPRHQRLVRLRLEGT
jgi:hypothetical protein